MTAKRTDDNQFDIVRDLAKMGLSVRSTAMVGSGFVDIVVGDPETKHNFLFEIKNPEQPPSKRKLTDDEQEFHDTWRAQVDVIETAHDAMDVINNFRLRYRIGR